MQDVIHISSRADEDFFEFICWSGKHAAKHHHPQIPKNETASCRATQKNGPRERAIFPFP
jgi:hypothetical protein